MKKIWILFMLASALWLAACGSATPAQVTTTPDGGYPGPGQIPAPANGYPGQQTPPLLAPPQAYPGSGEIWLIRPAGIQCEGKEYPDLATAVAALESAGVQVIASELVSLMVCEACGCPTSEHYRMQVNLVDIPKAENLGWIRE
jgi:hypothetical protein